MKIKNKDGKEVEVFTKEELDAEVKKATDVATSSASKLADEKAQQAIESYKASNPDKTKEIEKLKNDLAEAVAKLETAENYGKGGGEGGDRDQQIERLRKEKDEAVSNLTKKIDELNTQIQTGQQTQITNTKNSLLDKYAGKDPEVRKKVELEFDKYRADEVTPEQMENRMKTAVAISGVKVDPTPGPLDGGNGGGNRGDGNYGGGAPVVTDNAVKIGAALGVKKEELDKAAADMAKKNS